MRFTKKLRKLFSPLFFFIQFRYHISFKFKPSGATQQTRKLNLNLNICLVNLNNLKTYNPVENIPTVNTMQAHDRSCIKSIQRRKYEDALPAYMLSVICLLLPQNVKLQERKRCKNNDENVNPVFPYLQSTCLAFLPSDWLQYKVGGAYLTNEVLKRYISSEVTSSVDKI